MRHTLTLALASSIATLAGVHALTVAYESERSTPDARDGNARHAIARTLCQTLSTSDKGRDVLKLASTGDVKAVCALTLATPDAYKDSSKAMEAIRSALADPSKGWPVAIPRLHQHASRALESWQDAQDKASAKAAKAESAKATPAPAVTPRAPYVRPALTLATIQAHMAQEGSKVQGRKASPAWKGSKVA